MSAGDALQVALARELAAVAGIEGVYDGPPARAPYPYAVVDAGTEADWSHKSGQGREISVALTLWDEQPARLRGLADAVEQKIAGIEDVEGHQLVTLTFLRRRILRDVAGPWAAIIDFRAKLLAI